MVMSHKTRRAKMMLGSSVSEQYTQANYNREIIFEEFYPV